MASAVVNVKLSPNDLQIVDAALRYYADMIRYKLNPEHYERPEPDLSMVENSPRGGTMRASQITEELGYRR